MILSALALSLLCFVLGFLEYVCAMPDSAQASSSGGRWSSECHDTLPIRPPQPYDASTYLQDSSSCSYSYLFSTLPSWDLSLFLPFGPVVQHTAPGVRRK